MLRFLKSCKNNALFYKLLFDWTRSYHIPFYTARHALFSRKSRLKILTLNLGSELLFRSTNVHYDRRNVSQNHTILYIPGIAGGKWYNHSGSGSNYLCLPETPEYDDYQADATTYRGRVYSAEYQVPDFPPYAGKQNHDVPCAVCRATDRGSSMMIPAKMTCPAGWTREYHGYLMSENYVHSSTEFVCVDRNPEVVRGSVGDNNGALFYPVEARCDKGNLPCAPYIDGAELTCVVCTK